MSALISSSRRCIDGLECPRATISNDCSSGTPAFIMVASWRVNRVTSFSVIFLAVLNSVLCFLTLVTVMPCLRSWVLTKAKPPACIWPLTFLPRLSMPSHRKVASLTAFAAVAIRNPLEVGNGLDLFQRGETGFHFQQTCLAQVEHAFAPRLVGDVGFVAALEDDAGHGVGDRHHLIDTHPPLVASSAADVAADRLVGPPAAVELVSREARGQQRLLRDVDGLLARAQPPRQALRGNQDHRGGDVERRHSHVEQAGQGARRI